MPHPASDPTPLPALTASQWFAEEIDPHGPALRAYLRGSFPAVRDVDDVVQESFLRVWQARLNQRVKFSKSFLFQVARHVAIDLVRRERISPITAVADVAILPVADERPGVAQQACLHEELEFLIRALDSLPVRLREVIVLRRIDGLSQKEIADQLGLSELTVQTHIVRGLRRLEDYFRRHGPGHLSS
jgi:RNA polymerase sigma factor (sigma-70 family)